jgi:hypothetical protein
MKHLINQLFKIKKHDLTFQCCQKKEIWIESFIKKFIKNQKITQT